MPTLELRSLRKEYPDCTDTEIAEVIASEWGDPLVIYFIDRASQVPYLCSGDQFALEILVDRPGVASIKVLFGNASVPKKTQVKTKNPKKKTSTSAHSSTSPPSSGDAPEALQHNSSNTGLQLPEGFDGRTSYREMFQNWSHSRLIAMCRDLPVEGINLLNPEGEEMGRAITQVFSVSTFMATKEVSNEYGDLVFPRLSKHIRDQAGIAPFPDLFDMVAKFAVYLQVDKRFEEAVHVMTLLRTSPLWHAFGEGRLLWFICTYHVAMKDTNLEKCKISLDALSGLSDEEIGQVSQMAERLRKRQKELHA